MEEKKENISQEKPGIFIKKGDLIENEKGEPTGLKIDFDTRNALLFHLHMFSKSDKLKPEDKPGLLEALKYLMDHLVDLNLKITGKQGVRIEFKYLPEGDEIKEKIGYYLTSYQYGRYAITILSDQLRGSLKAQKKKPKEKKTKIRSGGHLIDNILKGGKPTQLSIFDNLLQETRDKIVSSGASIELINRKGEGIKLSKGEYRLLLCLTNLLYKKSQTDNTKEDNYYTGDKTYEIEEWEVKGKEVRVKTPQIGFTLYEITKEYYGEEAIGGENVRTVSKLLYDLAEDPNKKALMRYTRIVALDRNKTREYFIERYDSLINIATAGYKEMLNGAQIDERREIVVGLHPIFIDQIADKYIELPLDLTQRLIGAYGSPNISEITTKLILELYRAHSNRRKLIKDEGGNPIYQIGEEKLFYRIAEDYMPPNRRRIPLIREYLNKSIETAKSIGLLLNYEVKPGATGDKIYHFTLRKNWE